MVHAVDGAASEEAEIVCDLGEVRPVVRHVRTALTRLDELKGTLDVVTLAGFHGRLLLTVAGELLKVQLFQLRLRVEGIDVRWASFHHEEDHVLRLRAREVGLGIR